MEQLTLAVKHTAENATQASTTANAASEATSDSSAEVERVARTLNQLVTGYQQIGNILGVMRELRFRPTY